MIYPAASVFKVLYDAEKSYVNAGMPENSKSGIDSQLLQSGVGIPVSGGQGQPVTAGHGLVPHCPAMVTTGSFLEDNSLHFAFTVLKGTVARDFLLLVFFMNQFPPSPRVSRWDCFEFFRKFAEIFASKGARPVSATPAANLPPVSTTPVSLVSPVSTTPAANLPPVSTTPAANLPPVSMTPVANNGNNIRLLRP